MHIKQLGIPSCPPLFLSSWHFAFLGRFVWRVSQQTQLGVFLDGRGDGRLGDVRT